MLGLSIGKLLVLALVIVIVWQVFKRMGNQAARTAQARRETPRERARSVGEDLIACPACGTYAPHGLAKCPSGRDDCPLVGR